VPAWNGNFVYYAVGTKVTYNGELYECIQAHTSEPNWMPPVVPALWQDLGPCSAATAAVVFPNPVTSANTVQVAVPLTATSDVTLEVFTTNFRKVIHHSYPQTYVGTSLSLELNDDWGGRLANGLYYILAQGQGKHWVIKLLVIR